MLSCAISGAEDTDTRHAVGPSVLDFKWQAIVCLVFCVVAGLRREYDNAFRHASLVVHTQIVASVVIAAQIQRVFTFRVCFAHQVVSNAGSCQG